MMKKIHLIGLAVLSGLLLSAAWQTNYLVPLIFVAFVPLLFVQDYVGNPKNSGKGNIFLLSFLCFFIWNSLTTWWIWNSTSVGSIATFVLNSTFMATIFWLFHFTKTHLFENQKGNLILIFFWLSFEYLHFNWDLNWPWLSLGNIFSEQHTWVQWYEFTGVAGGTIWVLLSNILIFKLLKSLFSRTEKKKQLITFVILPILIIVVPIVISKILYNNYLEEGSDVEIVTVQPNFDPFTEQFELSAETIINRNLDLAESVISQKTAFVISPESAIQEGIWLPNAAYYGSIEKIKKFVDRHKNTAFIIGASTFGPVPDGMEDDFAARKSKNGYYYAYNTAFMIDSANVSFYNKSKFTPGVEKMPSWWILRPLQNFAIDLGGTVGSLKEGDGSIPFSFGNYKVAPLICYESVFGEFVTEFVRNGANLILIITNDGWWGNTPGHRQHFAFAKLRAIETRRSIARSANTGISGFINQKGDVIQQTKYWEPNVLKQSLKTNENITFYVRYGDYLSKTAVFLMTVMFLGAFVHKRLRKEKLF